MNTKRLWNPLLGPARSSDAKKTDRRSVARRRVDFYAVELAEGARYLRKVCNLSDGGLMLEDRLTYQRPGQIMELELPRPNDYPLRLRAEVVRVTLTGDVGLRTLGGPWMDGLGGDIDL